MELDHRTAFRVDLGSVTRELLYGDHDWRDDPQRPSSKPALDVLADVLRGLGLEVDVEASARGDSATVTVLHPTRRAAESMSKRGGRRRLDLPYESPLHGLTASEAVSWLDGHAQSEREAALGVSRSTCFRRMRELRAYAERSPDGTSWAREDNRH